MELSQAHPWQCSQSTPGVFRWSNVATRPLSSFPCPLSCTTLSIWIYLSIYVQTQQSFTPNNAHDKWQMSSIAALCPCESNLPKCCRYCCPGKCNASLRCARLSPESETPTKWYYCACVSAFIQHKHQTKSRSVNYVWWNSDSPTSAQAWAWLLGHLAAWPCAPSHTATRQSEQIHRCSLQPYGEDLVLPAVQTQWSGQIERMPYWVWIIWRSISLYYTCIYIIFILYI